MKILYVITGLGMGGAETITIDVAQKMLERGHEVAVLYLTGDNLQPVSYTHLTLPTIA